MCVGVLGPTVDASTRRVRIHNFGDTPRSRLSLFVRLGSETLLFFRFFSSCRGGRALLSSSLVSLAIGPIFEMLPRLLHGLILEGIPNRRERNVSAIVRISLARRTAVLLP